MLGLLLTSCIWAFSFGLTKKLTNLDPQFVAFVRLCLALPMFLPFLKLKGLSPKLILQLILIGAIEYGAFYSLYTTSYHYLPSYLVALFMVLGPLYITIISDAYVKHLRLFPLFMAILAVLGAVIIIYNPHSPMVFSRDMVIGFGLAQAAMFCFSFGQVAYKKVRTQHPGLKDVNIFALLYIGSVIVTGLTVTYNHSWNTFHQITSYEWLNLIYLGTVASGFCFFLWNKSAVKVSGGTLAVFNNLKIPLGILVSLVVFQEQADILKLAVGGSIIAGAIILSEWKSKKTKHAAEPV